MDTRTTPPQEALQELLNGRNLPTTDDDIVAIMREARGVDVTRLLAPPSADGLNRFPNGRPVARQAHADALEALDQISDVMSLAHGQSSIYYAVMAGSEQNEHHHSMTNHLMWNRTDTTTILSRLVSQMQEDRQQHLTPLMLREFLAPAYRVDFGAVREGDPALIIDVLQPLIYDRSGDRLEEDAETVMMRSIKTESDDEFMISYTGLEVTYNELVQHDTVDYLTSRGYDVEFGYAGHTGDNDEIDYLSIPLFAYPTSNHPLYGKHAIILGMHSSGYDHISFLLAHLLKHASMQRAEETTDEIDESIAAEVLMLQQVRAAAAQYEENVSTLSATTESQRTQLDSMTRDVASITRSYYDNTRLLRQMRSNMRGVVTETLSLIDGLPAMLEPMRPIKNACVKLDDGRLVVEFETHPFHLYNEDYDDGRLLPSYRIQIDPIASAFDRGITIRSSRGELPVIHPHVRLADGHICWGNAAIPIADAWGRRDWESVARLVLGWVTQYNDASPYQHWHTLQDELPYTDESGWLVQQEA